VIRVLLADDNVVVRHGLAAVLEASGEFTVVAQAGTGAEAVEHARRVKPELALLDVRMPVSDGVTAAAEIGRTIPVLMLTYAEDPEVVERALQAGASGYLVHGTFTPDELLAAARTVAAGGTVLGPTAAAVAVEAVRRAPSGAGQAVIDQLTLREREIMALVGRGRSNRQIADELVLSEKTVKNHLNRIYAKLGIRTRAEAVATWLGVE
jgi:DNA-binding NarL/FixJ family response regulator